MEMASRVWEKVHIGVHWGGVRSCFYVRSRKRDAGLFTVINSHEIRLSTRKFILLVLPLGNRYDFI